MFERDLWIHRCINMASIPVAATTPLPPLSPWQTVVSTGPGGWRLNEVKPQFANLWGTAALCPATHITGFMQSRSVYWRVNSTVWVVSRTSGIPGPFASTRCGTGGADRLSFGVHRLGRPLARRKEYRQRLPGAPFGDEADCLLGGRDS